MNRYVYVDNTFVERFMARNDRQLDFEKLYQHFKDLPTRKPGDEVNVFATYFFQKSSAMPNKTYKYLSGIIEKLGWEVEVCLEENIHNVSYSAAMEQSALLARMMSDACSEAGDGAEFFFCVNHLSYAPAFKQFRAEHDYQTTLVCDTTQVNPSLVMEVDELMHVDSMGVGLEGSTVPAAIHAKHGTDPSEKTP